MRHREIMIIVSVSFVVLLMPAKILDVIQVSVIPWQRISILQELDIIFAFHFRKTRDPSKAYQVKFSAIHYVKKLNKNERNKSMKYLYDMNACIMDIQQRQKNRSAQIKKYL